MVFASSAAKASLMLSFDCEMDDKPGLIDLVIVSYISKACMCLVDPRV